MKLRKAIKLAAAGAVLGIAPVMAMSAPGIPGFDNWSTATSDDGIVYSCAAGFSCDTANAIGGTGSDDPDFYQITITEISTGDTFYQTIQYDPGEGVFKAESFVGQEDNSSYGTGGVASKTFISEDQGTAGDDFDSTATITSYDFMVTGVLGGTSLRKVLLDQNVGHTSGGKTTFNSGFDFEMGEFSDVTDSVYEVSTITNGVTDDPLGPYAGEYTDSFEQIETKIEGAPTYDSLISKTLAATAYIDSNSGIPDEAFTQDFVRNEAEGAAVSDSGYVTAGTGAASLNFSFSAGDTIVALTLDQDVGGAAAKFSLSDAANESGTGEAGVDLHNGADSFIDATYTGGGETAYDPFVNF
jgi:hypothetical protein